MDKRNFGYMEDFVLKKYPDAIKFVKSDFDEVKTESIQEEINVNDYLPDFNQVFLSLRQDANKDDLSSTSEGRKNGLARVRINDSFAPASRNEPIPDSELNYPDGFKFGSYNNNSNAKGASFVLVIAALITLVLLVGIVTFGIMRIVA